MNKAKAARIDRAWDQLQDLAAQRGTLAKIRRILHNCPCDSSALQETMSELLPLAASAGNLPVVEHLVERGARINTADSEMVSPVAWAATRGDLRMARYLADKGADLNGDILDDWSPLQLAAMRGHLPLVRFFIDRGIAPDAVDCSGQDTPLGLAFWAKRNAVSAYLLRQLASRGESLDDYLCPAAKAGDLKSVRYLFARGCKPKTRKEVVRLFLAAAEGGSAEIIQISLDRGAKVRWIDDEGMTALHKATKTGATRAVSLLLRNGADVNARTNDGLTALHLAAAKLHTQIVPLLLRNGASTTLLDKEGRSPKDSIGTEEDAYRHLLSKAGVKQARERIRQLLNRKACK